MISIDRYPRPLQDTRICLHGTANQYNPWGPDIRHYMNEAKAMGVNWIKGLSDRDGNTGIQWARIALEMGLMPVVRIYQPMPWTLDDTIKKAIDRLIAAGVKYIETLNEPDNQQEWNPVPVEPRDQYGNPKWAYIAAQNQIAVARYIQVKGGIPLIASLSTGSPESYTDMTKVILQYSGKDVFDGLFAMSIHNYPLNHPIGMAAWGQTDTYPLDDVNLKGAPISEEMYRKYGDTNSLAWEGRTREWVNKRRVDRKNPGATMFTDNCGEVNLYYVAECAKKTLGFYPPCIVTEGGVIIGDAQDDRYPKNTGEYMRDANVEIARRCMGTSGKHNYPPYVLAGGGYWLLHNYGGPPNWNSQAWYQGGWSQYNSGGRLWVVDAMKALPKVAYGSPAPPEPEPPVPEPPTPEPDVDWQIPLPQVKLIPAGVKPGDTYWKLIKARWENEQQAQGRHHIYVNVLNKAGQRLAGIPVTFINGGTVIGRTETNKPLEFGMYGTLGSYTVYVAQGISDWVTGLGMGTPEQPTYKIHTCFHLTFQETTKGEPEPEPEPEPVPGPDPSDRHCIWMAQRTGGIEWGVVEALRSYLECYRSTLTYSHHDAAGLDGGGGYANVTAISSDTMPHSQEAIEIVRNAPAVKWLEVIKVVTLAELKVIMDERAAVGRKYGV